MKTYISVIYPALNASLLELFNIYGSRGWIPEKILSHVPETRSKNIPDALVFFSKRNVNKDTDAIYTTFTDYYMFSTQEEHDDLVNSL